MDWDYGYGGSLQNPLGGMCWVGWRGRDSRNWGIEVGSLKRRIGRRGRDGRNWGIEVGSLKRRSWRSGGVCQRQVLVGCWIWTWAREQEKWGRRRCFDGVVKGEKARALGLGHARGSEGGASARWHLGILQ